MSTKHLIAAVAAAATLAAAGCAEDRTTQPGARATPAHTADRERAAQRVRWFLLAMESRQDARACRMMTPRLRHGISFFLERNAEPGSCRTRAAHIYSIAKAPGHPGARVTALALHDDAATATVTAPGTVESAIELRKVAGRWLIADF
jgi:hypothetical protein